MKITKVFLLISLLFFSCQTAEEKGSRVASLPYYNEASFTPHWMEPGSSDLANFHTISDFSLMNQEGETITQKTFENKIYITDFFFTYCTGICPKMTANMEVVQEAFLNDLDVLLLSHSVTPEHDSIPVLKFYAETKGVVSGKWHLVTGSVEEIYRLGRADYFVEEDLGIAKDSEDFLHTENFVLIDKNRHIRGIYNGLNRADIDQLIEDIKTLKKES
jgi:protein SCO1